MIVMFFAGSREVARTPRSYALRSRLGIRSLALVEDHHEDDDRDRRETSPSSRIRFPKAFILRLSPDGRRRA
jgi:hypothetical protein